MDIDIQLLKATLKYRGITYAVLAKAMGMNRDTFARRLRNKDFRVKEVHIMMKFVPLTMEEVFSIFFQKKTERGNALLCGKM